MKLLNYLFTKKFTARNISLRLAAVFTLIIGIFAAWMWQASNKSAETHFFVQIVPENHARRLKETEVQDRNLTEYETAPNFSNCVLIQGFAECENKLDQGREFIVKNFQAKKRSCIIYEFTGADMGADIYFFTEPDKNGTWRIVKRWITYQRTIEGPGIPEMNERIAYKLQKKRPSENDDRTYHGKFHLSFFDKRGKENGTL